MKKDSVWFTYKARIQAHKRLEWLDFHSQLLLVWYAILSTALGVLTIRHSTILGPDTDIMATILSVALLGISLAVANRDFRGRAMLMRTNYLELQKLHRGIPDGPPNTPPPAPTSEQINRYDELLAESENHREIDDRIARIFAGPTTRETPSKLPISRKWTAWGCRKTRFSAADYWITKAKPWLSGLTGAPLPQQAI
ncbi:SLATT domain-containing protein, partial [Pseudomonas monteilii]|uniref:SLATT domain-containing protein n=1 Tax=Pseudomonas monteilii TaxID=76759 RepID=UPI001E5FC542|nr:SLATT domain-containing protein [Pseudomonas monteilii]